MFASNSELVEDVRKAPEDVLSTNAGVIEVHDSFGCLTWFHSDHTSSLRRNIHSTYWTWTTTIMQMLYVPN